MAETTARRVADLILSLANRRGMEMTNLKLQKLLYYAQAWHLAVLDKPLFPERIEAWIHGPVVPPVFGDFKHYRWNPIDSTPADVAIEAGDPRWPISECVREVLDAYGGFSGPQLEAMTHQEDPWKEARKGIPSDTPSTSVISHEAMIRFYRPQLTGVSD
jgi:uncharacterized phage-associated protein